MSPIAAELNIMTRLKILVTIIKAYVIEKLPIISNIYTNTPAKLKQPTIINLGLFLGSVSNIVKVGNIPINSTMVNGRVALKNIKIVINMPHFWKIDMFLNRPCSRREGLIFDFIVLQSS